MAAQPSDVSDPRVVLADSRMRRPQILIVAICVLLNALDGYDVLSISFASPGIASEWGVTKAALGIVLSMELIGMAAGSIVIGNLADRFGRRPVTLACLAVMVVGMALATTSGDVTTLSVFRLFTGLGIGGMLACTNAIVAEFSNTRSKTRAIGIMAVGYPAGAVLGGSVAAVLLEQTGSWRSVFWLGAIVAVVSIPLVWFFVPESVGFVLQRRRGDALDAINTTLTRLGHRTVPLLPPISADEPKASVKQLFTGKLARVTILLTVAYFAHIMTFYFILKWIPKIVVDMGNSPSTAAGVLVWANVGGLLGGLLLSVLSVRMNTRNLAMIGMVASVVAVIYFGTGQNSIAGLSLVAAAVGFCTNSVVCALYALIAHSFPTSVRAGGTGFVIGVGRGGAALGPVIAGFLFQSGIGLQGVSIAMASGSAVAAICMLLLGSTKESAL
ncbi:MFS transporter [Gordonia oryzae]|nr:MFS transporter [Gordonia oryzae]